MAITNEDSERESHIRFPHANHLYGFITPITNTDSQYLGSS